MLKMALHAFFLSVSLFLVPFVVYTSGFLVLSGEIFLVECRGFKPSISVDFQLEKNPISHKTLPNVFWYKSMPCCLSESADSHVGAFPSAHTLDKQTKREISQANSLLIRT